MHAQWQLSGLDAAVFEPMFGWSDDALRSIGAVRRTANDAPGFPCRVSLEDAPVGAELLLLPFEHQPARSPYRASGPIFVRRGAVRSELAPGEVPASVTQRLISLRGYDADAMIIQASVCEGSAVAAALDGMFADAAVAYVHLHNAKRGCYSCLASRVG
ncbi:MAG TPA: DUF1203 domain-containing protein [Caldimonas sp.]